MSIIIKNPKVYSDELSRVKSDTPVDESVMNPYFEKLVNNDAFLKEVAEMAIGLSIEDFKDPSYSHGTLVSNAEFLKDFFEELTSNDGAKMVGMTSPPSLGADNDVDSILRALDNLLKSALGADYIGVQSINGLSGDTVQKLLVSINNKINGLKLDWGSVINKPSTYPPSPHSHGKSDIGVSTGTGTFPGGGATKKVAHGLGAVPSYVNVMPTGIPGGYLGEVWVGALDSVNFTIGNTGSYTGEFRFMAVK